MGGMGQKSQKVCNLINLYLQADVAVRVPLYWCERESESDFFDLLPLYYKHKTLNNAIVCKRCRFCVRFRSNINEP